MTRHNGFFRLGALLLLVGGTLAAIVFAQTWDRIELAGGGVAEDLNYVTHGSSTTHDILWAACVNGGLFRSEYNSGWQDWEGYCYGRHMRGVDAIEFNGDEYVMGAGHDGLWYCKNSFSTQPWLRPNYLNYPSSYGNDWRWVLTHDAAFYWPTSGSPDPENQYFVILSTSIPGSNPEKKPGIYRWDDEYSEFDRADNGGNNPYIFSEFYRDLGNRNVLYVTSFDGAIYKLYGEYNNPKFEKLPPFTRLEDLPIARIQKNLPPLPHSNKR